MADAPAYLSSRCDFPRSLVKTREDPLRVRLALFQMAPSANKDDWMHLILCSMRRFLLSRNGHLLLGVTIFGILIVWLNMKFSNTVLQDTPTDPVKDSIYPYFAETVIPEEPNPAELEQQRRIAVFTRILRKQNRKRKRVKDQTQCIHPKLDLKHDANQFAYYVMPPLNCTGNGMFFSRRKMLILNSSVIPDLSLLGKCSFYGVERVNDNLYSYTKPETKESPPFQISMPHDFVRITCVLKTTLEKAKELENEESNTAETDKGKVEKESKNQSRPDEKNFDRENKISENDEKHTHANNTSSDYIYSDDYNEEWYADFFKDGDFMGYGDPDYDQFLVQIHPKPQVFQRIAKAEALSGKSHLELNVLMFALDSMSHLCYMRKLPQTYRFLKEELGAAIMENYNIVGDATTAAIIPMLTGLTEMDLPEVRLSKLEGKMVDEYPLIWKKFQEHGYATLFAEDEPTLSTFNLRLNGFDKPPTDHYMRPFWMALWDSSLRQNSERFCTGNTAHHRFMLHYLEDFFVKYNNVSKFAFGFHGELSHADNNPAQYIDEEFVEFLKRLRKGKLLEDTVLIVFGDHGARYSKVRNTVQGKLEERLPFMSFTFPPKFRKFYPHLYQNLLTNTQRLSTPFDIHKTLLDILDLSGTSSLGVDSNTLGISLLREIPASRTCKEAGISMHWCTCLHQVTVDKNEDFVKPAVLAVMRYLNAQTMSHRDECAELHLTEVLNVQMIIPNERVLKYSHSKDSDQRVANFSTAINLDVVHYQLQVETGPCGGVFEATIMADFRSYSDYKFTVTPGISRINQYGSQPKCIEEHYPSLRKFCCCQDYLQKRRVAEKMKDSGEQQEAIMKLEPHLGEGKRTKRLQGVEKWKDIKGKRHRKKN